MCQHLCGYRELTLVSYAGVVVAEKTGCTQSLRHLSGNPLHLSGDTTRAETDSEEVSHRTVTGSYWLRLQLLRDLTRMGQRREYCCPENQVLTLRYPARAAQTCPGRPHTAWRGGQTNTPYGQLRQEELTAVLQEKAASKNGASQMGTMVPFEG